MKKALVTRIAVAYDKVVLLEASDSVMRRGCKISSVISSSIYFQ